MFKVNFRLVTLQLNQIGRLRLQTSLAAFFVQPGKKKHKKSNRSPKCRRKNTNLEFGLFGFCDMKCFPTFFLSSRFGVGSRVLPYETLGMTTNPSPSQVTVTNPLEIPEINTWSFEHRPWLGIFFDCLDVPGGKLGWISMVRTDQWELFHLLISKWDILG